MDNITDEIPEGAQVTEFRFKDEEVHLLRALFIRALNTVLEGSMPMEHLEVMAKETHRDFMGFLGHHLKLAVRAKAMAEEMYRQVHGVDPATGEALAKNEMEIN